MSLSEAGPGRFGGQLSFADLYHTTRVAVAAIDVTMPYVYHTFDRYIES